MSTTRDDVDDPSAKGDLAKRRSAATWFAMIDPADRKRGC
jgi:hypothetical protein